MLHSVSQHFLFAFLLAPIICTLSTPFLEDVADYVESSQLKPVSGKNNYLFVYMFTIN